MVRNRIWASEPLKRNFFNNLHLGYRSIDIMNRLAKRSVYLKNMNNDIFGSFNECADCNIPLMANKRPEPLLKEEADFPFQKLAMDIAETYKSKEHFLVIVDRYSGYVWAGKTGNKETGTSNKILEDKNITFDTSFRMSIMPWR